MALGAAMCQVIVNVLFLKEKQGRWLRGNSQKVREHHALLSLI